MGAAAAAVRIPIVIYPDLMTTGKMIAVGVSALAWHVFVLGILGAIGAALCETFAPEPKEAA